MQFDILQIVIFCLIIFIVTCFGIYVLYEVVQAIYELYEINSKVRVNHKGYEGHIGIIKYIKGNNVLVLFSNGYTEWINRYYITKVTEPNVLKNTLLNYKSLLICVLLVVIADHMILSCEIERAKNQAIDQAVNESGDLDRDEVKPSCLK